MSSSLWTEGMWHFPEHLLKQKQNSVGCHSTWTEMIVALFRGSVSTGAIIVALDVVHVLSGFLALVWLPVHPQDRFQVAPLTYWDSPLFQFPTDLFLGQNSLRFFFLLFKAFSLTFIAGLSMTQALFGWRFRSNGFNIQSLRLCVGLFESNFFQVPSLKVWAL